MTTETNAVPASSSPTPSAGAVWAGMLHGQTRIVDWYDRNGRRFLVAKSEPAGAARPVPARRLRALARRAQGASMKVIASELGLSMGTVSRDLALTMSRLGLESVADLVAVLGLSVLESGPGVDLAELPPPRGLIAERHDSLGADHVVLSFPLANESRLPEGLTEAERGIVGGILAGLPNAEIARRRGVAGRTVANQISRIFSKLRIGSRLDLALLVHHEAAGHESNLQSGGVAA